MNLRKLSARLRGRRATPSPTPAAIAAEVFETALLVIDDGRVTVAAGEAVLADCAARLGIAADAEAVLAALAALDAETASALAALTQRGAPCSLVLAGPGGAVAAEGRARGALAWLRLSPAPTPAAEAPGMDAEALRALLDARAAPAWIVSTDGAPMWGNAAWRSATEDGAHGLDTAADELARRCARSGTAGVVTRWLDLDGEQRSWRITVTPLPFGAAVWADDVTEGVGAREAEARLAAAQAALLGDIADAVAVFGPDQRLAFHNDAFVALWGLEPAWLEERPTQGEWLDRLRQRRLLPETTDYPAFRAAELARHALAGPPPETIWRLPQARTLRLRSHPHPGGGISLVFSDITPELRLKSQFNQLIQVQRATLDKLTDAVAVFGADARLRLHNEAFERFWSVTGAQLAAAADFDGVVDYAVRRLHDLRFWNDLKARIGDPDPRARAPMAGETTTADSRTVAWQSRPLPDGATLISFTDVTDTRRMQTALAEREAALRQSEQLTGAFVASVSHELRAPLTTILGYAEMLEPLAAAWPAGPRGYLAAVRQAADTMAESLGAMIAMAELDAGLMRLSIGDIEVAALLRAAADRWTPQRLAGVSLRVDAGAQAAGVTRGDWRRLGQALDQLTANAVRNTPSGGEVVLSASREAGEVRLRVSDTGRGIPYHVQANVFSRFNGEISEGAGLGLPLVRALVELHGGWVAVESEPGAGATFTCHLPDAPEG